MRLTCGFGRAPRYIRAHFSALLLFCAFFVIPASAQLTPSVEITLEKQLKKSYQDDVDEWRSKAHLEVALEISIIAFGALITLVQGLNRTWTKSATLVLAAGITILTGINSHVFEADYKSFRSASRETQRAINKLDDSLQLLNLPDPDVAFLARQRVEIDTKLKGYVDDILHEDKDIVGSESNKPIKGMLFVPFELQAYAQSQEPLWYVHRPHDSDSLYFVGYGEDQKLSIAQSESSGKAIQDGVNFISGGKDLDLGAISKLIRTTAETANTYFTYDKNSQKYRFYTLLRISKQLQSLDFSRKPIIVDSRNEHWTMTDVYVNKGDRVLFTASGIIHWADGPNDVCGPDGSPNKIHAALHSLRGQYPIKFGRAGALIARIGGGRPFKVGASLVIDSAQDQGNIELFVNDNEHDDNKGQFSVTIMNEHQ